MTDKKVAKGEGKEIEKETILHHDDTIFYPRVAYTGMKILLLKSWMYHQVIFHFAIRNDSNDVENNCNNSCFT